MIEKKLWGKTAAGEEVYVYKMTNANGLSVEVITFGARILSVNTPDRDGNFADVTVSPANIEGFEAHNNFFGATIGRYGNRIKGAKIELDGETYQLTVNEHGANILHGGSGVHNLVWDSAEDGEQVVMTCLLPDGKDGFPGNCTIVARFQLTDDNTLILGLQAVSDKPTVCNLTNHTYWTMGGAIEEQQLMISADQYLTVDKELIPDGIANVEGTAFDFRAIRPIGNTLYDHDFLFNGTKPCAKLYSPATGRSMTLMADMPGVQLYTYPVFGSKPRVCAAVCLEPQFNPDSPNHPEWPSTVLRPGEVWNHEIRLTFGVE